MSEVQIITFLENYGLLCIFIIVFMEYLNLPGFPAGVILPVIGLWSSDNIRTFLEALIISVVAGLLGSLLLYYVGKIGGKPLLEKIVNKHPKSGEKLKSIESKINNNANKAILIAKLMPVARTLVGLPAGAVGMQLSKYLTYSCLGIIIWNSIFMLSGSMLNIIL